MERTEAIRLLMKHAGIWALCLTVFFIIVAEVCSNK
jgi:hypothetical protein